MSLSSVWDSYDGSCLCTNKQGYKNNCAHNLSNAMILGGYSELDGGNGAEMRIASGFCVCSKGRPIRAKEMRYWFGSKWTRHSNPTEGINVVYQEQSGQGHVLLKKYSGGKCIGHRGTGDFPNWSTQEYYY